MISALILSALGELSAYEHRMQRTHDSYERELQRQHETRIMYTAGSFAIGTALILAVGLRRRRASATSIDPPLHP